MYDLVIRGARLADDTLIDLAVKDGKIASVGRLAADVSAVRQLDLAGNCRLNPRARGAGVWVMSICPIDSRRLGREKKEIPITKAFIVNRGKRNG